VSVYVFFSAKLTPHRKSRRGALFSSPCYKYQIAMRNGGNALILATPFLVWSIAYAVVRSHALCRRSAAPRFCFLIYYDVWKSKNPLAERGFVVRGVPENQKTGLWF